MTLFGLSVPRASFAIDKKELEPTKLKAKLLAVKPITFKSLKWESDSFKIYNSTGSGGQSKVYLELKGKFTKPGYTLLISNEEAEENESGEFEHLLLINDKEPEVALMAIDPAGKVLRTVLVFKIPDEVVLTPAPLPKKTKPTKAAKITKVVAPVKAEPQAQSAEASDPFSPVGLKPWTFTVGLGITAMSYSQSGVQDFSQESLTAKVQVHHWLIPGLVDSSASAFYNVLPIATTVASQTIHFFGLNARAGYKIQSVHSPWSLTVNGGIYFLTTSASGLFGFTGVAGPSIYPVVRLTLPKDRSTYAYLKFSPITQSFGILDLSSNEFAMGTGYGFPFMERGYTASLDISFLNLLLSGTRVTSNSYSLGLSTNL